MKLLNQCGPGENLTLNPTAEQNACSVSSRVSIVRNRICEDKGFKDKFDRVNALIKM